MMMPLKSLLILLKAIHTSCNSGLYETWNLAKGPDRIHLNDVCNASIATYGALNESFLRFALIDAPGEQHYMRAMAELGPSPHRDGVHTYLKVKSQTTAPTRSALIKKGMIYSPAHGDTAFIAFVDDYLRRLITGFIIKEGAEAPSFLLI